MIFKIVCQHIKNSFIVSYKCIEKLQVVTQVFILYIVISNINLIHCNFQY